MTPARIFTAIEQTLIRRWRLDEGLPLAEIARRLHCGGAGLHRYMRAAGLPIRGPRKARQPRPLSAEDAAELRRLVSETTLSIRAIAAEIGHSKEWTRQRIHQLGLAPLRRPRPEPIRTNELVARVRPLLREGMSYSAAARALDVTKNMVAGALWRAGLCKPAVALELKPTFDPFAADRPICLFPIGRPGTDQFRLCGAAPLPGRSYCAAHHAITHAGVLAPLKPTHAMLAR